MRNHFILFITFFIFFQLSKTTTVYISPTATCGSSCTGDITDPYGNILDALSALDGSSTAALVLIKDASNPHYVLASSSNIVANGAYSSSTSSTIQEFSFGDLLIKPLFCNEEPAASDSSLSSSCTAEGGQLTVYLKTTDFVITTIGTLQIEGVVFDAVEDIMHFNAYGTELVDCLTSRQKCCTAGTTDSDVYPGVLVCEISGDYSSLGLTAASKTIFKLSDDTSASTTRIVEIEDSGFNNFLSPHLEGLIQAGSLTFDVTIMGSSFDRVYFDKGVILYADTLGTSPMSNSSYIGVIETMMTDYNAWDLYLEDATRQEGYLLYAVDIYSGVIEIKDSTFNKAGSSLRNTCWEQESTYYTKPMNNLLNTDQRSRSDLWTQYVYSNTTKDFVSSLVYVEAINGAISIYGSTFENIIGTSGSVLRVDDVEAQNNWFTVYNSTFDGNFAYDSFANIRIAKTTDPTFASMLECPHIEVVDSFFLNTYGCPGAYGNLMFLCSWDSEPPSRETSLSDYTVTSELTELTTAWTDQDETASYIRVKTSTFQHNLLSVSNSLAIVGTVFTILENNTFSDNGGTTAEIAEYSLEDSYFLTRYPSAVSFPLTLTHFGQSSVVYFDRVVRMYSKNNIYSGNWGPWEGSLALANSVTIKNWVKMWSDIKFDGDYYGDNQGVPSYFTDDYPDTAAVLNSYNEPMIAISVDVDGSDAMASVISDTALQNPSNIVFNDVEFHENIVSYDYDSYTYNSDELSDLLTNVIALDSRYQTGLVKLLWLSEAIDDLSYGFKSDIDTLTKTSFTLTNTIISSNQLLTMGCLFTTVSFLDALQITNNQIYADGEYFIQYPDVGSSYAMDVAGLNQGLFCAGTDDFTGSSSRVQITANNLFVRDNLGIVVNLNPSTSANFYLTNSQFVNNICLSLSIINVRDNNQFYSVNNIFTNNNNSCGVIFSYSGSTTATVYHTYLKNTGAYASFYYIESNTEGFEILPKLYWNDVEPEYKVFEDGLIPQSGLYFWSYSYFTVLGAEIKENTAYCGLATGYAGAYYIYDTVVSDHSITGGSIIGTYLAQVILTLSGVNFTNNYIGPDSSLPNLQPAFFSVITGQLAAENVNITGGGASSGASLVFTNVATGSITNMQVADFYRQDKGQAALFYMSNTRIAVDSLVTTNTTGIFKLESCTLNLTNSQISDIVNTYSNQFLIDMSDTTLNVNGLTFTGNDQYNTLLPFIGGTKNSASIVNSYFSNATGGTGQVFNLKSSTMVFVSGTTFKYVKNSLSVTVFSLTSSTNVVIQDCVFKLAGQVLSATTIQTGLYFMNNVIMTNSHLQNIYVKSAAYSYFAGNTLLKTKNVTITSLPESQVEFLDSTSSTVIENNKFIMLWGTKGIVEILASSYAYNVNISQNYFMNNTAVSGGALYLSATKAWTTTTTPTALISNSVFLTNYAMTWGSTNGKAGAIYQTSSTSTAQNTTIIGSSFIANSAQVIGGAIYFDFSPPTVSSTCVFDSNFATVENHIASYPVTLIAYHSSNTTLATYIPGTTPTTNALSALEYWTDVGSGVTTDQDHSFILLDMYSQVVYDDNSSTLTLSPDGFTDSTKSSFSSKLSYTASQGFYNVSDFKWNYRVGKSLQITFKSSAIKSYSTLPVSTLTITPSVKVQATFRDCGMGEYNVISGSLKTCSECPSGFWQTSLSTSASSCTSCDLDSTICRGGSNVGPRYGYWRLNSTADLVLACPREESCLGNSDSSSIETLDPTGACAEGYEGNLCYQCEDGWGRGGSGACVNCEKNSAFSYFLLFIMIALQVGFVAYGVRQMIYYCQVYTKKVVSIDASTLLRILISYAQIFNLIIDVDITWPYTLGKFLKITAKLSSITDQLFSVDCFFNKGVEALGIELPFIKALYTALIPFAFILVSVIFWLAFFRIKKRPIRGNKQLVNYIITTTVIICFSLQTSVIKSNFALFKCDNLYRDDAPLNFLENYYDTKCWEGAHTRWALGLAVPSLFVWVIIIPGWMMNILHKNRHTLHRIQMTQRYSFIYNGFNSSKYFWEGTIMIRKLLFIANTVFTKSVNLQIFLNLLLLILSFMVHAKGQPYSAKDLNHLEKVGLISIGIVNLAGFYFQVVTDGGAINVLVAIVGVFGNLFFFVVFLRLFVGAYMEELKKNKHFMKLYNFCIRKFGKYFDKNSRMQKIILQATDAMRRVSVRLQGLPLGGHEAAKQDQEHEEGSKIELQHFLKGPLSKMDLSGYNSPPIMSPKMSGRPDVPSFLIDGKEAISHQYIPSFHSDGVASSKYLGDDLNHSIMKPPGSSMSRNNKSSVLMLFPRDSSLVVSSSVAESRLALNKKGQTLEEQALPGDNSPKRRDENE